MRIGKPNTTLSIGFFLSILLGISFSACTSSTPSFQGGAITSAAAEAPPEVRPPDMPTLPVDSGPQIGCREVRAHPELATPEELKACEDYVAPEDLPNARDIINNQEIPTRLPPPTLGERVDPPSTVLVIQQPNDLEGLRRAGDIEIEGIDRIEGIP